MASNLQSNLIAPVDCQISPDFPSGQGKATTVESSRLPNFFDLKLCEAISHSFISFDCYEADSFEFIKLSSPVFCRTEAAYTSVIKRTLPRLARTFSLLVGGNSADSRSSQNSLQKSQFLRRSLG